MRLASRSRRSESGVTLIELLLGSALMLVVLSMGYGILITTDNTARTVTYEALNSTAARIGVDQLEADIRNADEVWVCGTVVTAGTCPTPTTGSATTLIVHDNTTATPSEPACTTWTFTGGNLDESVDGAAATIAVQGATPSATDGGYLGFEMPAGVVNAAIGKPTLVEIDFSVNTEKVVHPNDTVTAHDLVTPINMATDSQAYQTDLTTFGTGTCTTS